MLHDHHRKRRPHCTEEEFSAPWNKILLPDSMHDWIHANPKKAYEYGLLVKSHEDPREVQITIPEELVKKIQAKAKKKDEAPRPKIVFSFKVPVDQRENGHEVLSTLVDECRKELVANEFAESWEDDVPPYFVLAAVLSDWLKSR